MSEQQGKAGKEKMSYVHLGPFGYEHLLLLLRQPQAADASSEGEKQS